jgi:hypothetical protein
MGGTAGSRGVFGGYDPEEGPSASPSDERSTGGRGGRIGGHDGATPKKSPGLDLHPLRVRHNRFLSEIF